jgi:hypothetical protein
MKRLLQANQWQVVLQIFDSLRSQIDGAIDAQWQVGGEFNHISTPCWNVAIQARSRGPKEFEGEGQVTTVIGLVNEAIESEIPLSVQTYESAIYACAIQHKDWQSASHILDRLIEDTANIFEGGTFVNKSRGDLIPKVSPKMICALLQGCNHANEHNMSLYYLQVLSTALDNGSVNLVSASDGVEGTAEASRSSSAAESHQQRSKLVERFIQAPLLSSSTPVLIEAMKSFLCVGGVQQAKDLYHAAANPMDEEARKEYKQLSRQNPPSLDDMEKLKRIEGAMAHVQGLLDEVMPAKKSNSYSFLMSSDVSRVMKTCTAAGCPSVGVRLAAKVGRSGKCETTSSFTSFLAPPSSREDETLHNENCPDYSSSFLSSTDDLLAATIQSLRAMGQSKEAIQLFADKKAKSSLDNNPSMMNLLPFRRSPLDDVASWILSSHECLRAHLEVEDVNGAWEAYQDIDPTSRTKVTYNIMAQGMFDRKQIDKVQDIWRTANDSKMLSEKICVLTLESICQQQEKITAMAQRALHDEVVNEGVIGLDSETTAISDSENEGISDDCGTNGEDMQTDVTLFARVVNSLERLQDLRRGTWIQHHFDFVQRVVVPSGILEFLWQGRAFPDWELSFWRQGIIESIQQELGSPPHKGAFVHVVQLAGHRQRFQPCRGDPVPDVDLNDANKDPRGLSPKKLRDKLHHQNIDRADGIELILKTLQQARDCHSEAVSDPGFIFEAVRGLRALKGDQEVLDLINELFANHENDTQHLQAIVLPKTLAQALHCANALGDRQQKEHLISQIAELGYDYRNILNQ